MDSDENYDPTESISSQTEEVEPQFSALEEATSKQRLEHQIEVKNTVPEGVPLYSESADKTSEAREHYTELEACAYQNKQLGASGQEAMTCVCSEEWDEGVNHACEDEDCINRGTKVECINDEGSCGNDCQNQRFQKREYAPVTVFQTEKKGYGLRVDASTEADALVYEYIGEVIDEKTFKSRMVEYDHMKIKHFYFMMLQKGEFIDATRKGSLGRFCNHSCNPNCYVEKWVVGEKLKMGIFAKRRIVAGEELTFNYNVDRYGANAQSCYCGERNCIGFIGGKTQTEAASLLPQSISNALGSSIEDEQEFLKAMKARGEKVSKSDNNINVEYVTSLVMRPIEIHEVKYVMGALLQTEDPIIAEKLVERLELSSDAVLQKAKYLHGFPAFGRIFKFSYDNSDRSWFEVDDQLMLRLFKFLESWVVSKDFLRKARVIPTVEEVLKTTESDEIKSCCEDLLEQWSHFEEYKRIAKRTVTKEQLSIGRRHHENSSAERSESPKKEWRKPEWKYGWVATTDDEGRTYYFSRETRESSWEEPIALSTDEKLERDQARQQRQAEERKKQKEYEEREKRRAKQKGESDLASIIENAKRVERERLEKMEQEKRLEEEKRAKKLQYKLRKLNKSGYTEEELKKRWTRFFAQEVPNMLKRYREEIQDEVKTCGKEICLQLSEKEFKKDPSKKPGEKMESDKRKKVKVFVETYMEKFLLKYRAKQKRKMEERDESRKRVHT